MTCSSSARTPRRVDQRSDRQSEPTASPHRYCWWAMAPRRCWRVMAPRRCRRSWTPERRARRRPPPSTSAVTSHGSRTYGPRYRLPGRRQPLRGSKATVLPNATARGDLAPRVRGGGWHPGRAAPSGLRPELGGRGGGPPVDGCRVAGALQTSLQGGAREAHAPPERETCRGVAQRWRTCCEIERSIRIPPEVVTP